MAKRFKGYRPRSTTRTYSSRKLQRSWKRKGEDSENLQQKSPTETEQPEEVSFGQTSRR